MGSFYSESATCQGHIGIELGANGLTIKYGSSMCGISGYLSKSRLETSSLAKMNSFIKHRGPDDEGFLLAQTSSQEVRVLGGQDTASISVNSEKYNYNPQYKIDEVNEENFNLFLGHRRLSIIDMTSAGHQPMSEQTEKIWITYNGEVYNYLELRKELEALGSRFRTHTDTEVIIKAYEKWGTDCLNKFNGMFSFLIYDSVKNKLFAARDRFGVKPLYYWVSSNGIAFGSEIKQFTALPGWNAKLNHQRAYDFLSWSILDHTDETMFEGVFQVRGGQFIELDLNAANDFQPNSKLPIKTWYTLVPKKFNGSLETAVEKFRELFFDSIRLRLRADVPVGSCLSGGLDSSSIVCSLDQIISSSGKQVEQATFSACSESEKVDESRFIDIVNQHTRTTAYKFTPHPNDVLDKKDKIIWHQDEPFGSTSIMAQWGVFEMARRQKVVVMLDGQGADEQLAGYDGYMFARLAGLLKALRLPSFFAEFKKTKQYRGYSNRSLIPAILNYLLPNSLRLVGRKMFGKSNAKPNWLNFENLKVEAVDPMYKNGAISTKLNEISHSQLTSTNLQMLLHWEDRDSMAHSIESRLPFLDYRLVEFVLGLPDQFKLSDGITKKVLRLAMEKILPEKIQWRMDKIGFATAEEAWVKGKSRAAFRAELEGAVASSNGILSREILTIFDEIADGKRPFNYFIWRAISFGSWMKQFNVKV